MTRYHAMRGTTSLRVFVILAASALASVCFCLILFAREPVSKKPDRFLRQNTWTAIAPIRLPQGLAGRSSVPLPNGQCIILHCPMKFLSYGEMIARLGGDPNTAKDDLHLFREPVNSRWHVSRYDLSDLSTFNCATYALGDAIGLSKSDWVEPLATSWTGMQSSAKAILDDCFVLIESHDADGESWQTLETSPTSQHHDVVAFLDEERGYAHFGRISKVGQQSTLVSKLGTGPIVHGTTQRTSLRVSGTFDKVQLFRQIEQ